MKNIIESKWLGITLIILITFLIYSNSFKNKFIYDDIDNILNNTFIKNVENIPQIFSKNYYVFAQELTFRPVVTLSYFFDYWVWRLNVFGWHLTNILLHVLNGICIYFITRMFFKDNLTSLLCALFFVTHPIATEPVDGISLRDDLLAFFFFSIALYFYLKSQILDSNHFTILTILSFVFGILSKEIVYIWPITILLVDRVIQFKYQSIIATIKRIVFFSLLIIVFIIFKSYLLKPSGYVMNIDIGKPITYPGGNIFVATLTFLTAFLKYIWLLVYPLSLSIDNPIPLAKDMFQIPVLLGLLTIICLIIISFKTYKTNGLFSFAILFFFLTLIPVSNIILPIGDVFAVRYLYFGLFGWSILLTILVTKFNNFIRQKFLLQKNYLTLLFSVFILFFYGINTYKQNTNWKDEFIAWSNVLRIYPNSLKAHINLGAFYYEKEDKDKALYYFDKALLLSYTSYTSPSSSLLCNLGVIYAEKEMYDKAFNYFDKALSIKPNNPDCYILIGVAYAKKKDYKSAVDYFKKTLTLMPTHPLANKYLEICNQIISKKGGIR